MSQDTKNWDDYKNRSKPGFLRPIEFNHAGEKLYLAAVGSAYRLQVFGPRSDRRAVVEVVSIDEDAETITVCNHNGHDGQQETIGFAMWAWMRPELVT